MFSYVLYFISKILLKFLFFVVLKNNRLFCIYACILSDENVIVIIMFVK